MKLFQLPLALLLFSVCALTVSFGQDSELIKRAEAGEANAQYNLGRVTQTGPPKQLVWMG